MEKKNIRFMKKYILLTVIVLLVVSGKIFAQWTALSGPPGGSIEKVQVDAANKAYALVGSQDLYTSSNDGVSWTKIAVNDPSNFYFYDILVDGTTLFATDYQFFYKSTDGGLNWVVQNPNSFFTYGDNLIKVATNTYAVYSYQGMFISSDAGVTWIKINETQVFHAVATATGNLYFIDNEGVNRHLASAQPWASSNVTLVNPYTEGKGDDHLAVQGTTIFLQKYTDFLKSPSGNVGTWVSAKGTVLGSIITDTNFYGQWSLAPTGDLYYFNGSSRKIYKTTSASAGAAWTIIPSTLWPTVGYSNTAVSSAVFTSATKGFVGTFGDGIFLTTDGGSTAWNFRSNGINKRTSEDIEVASSGRIIQVTSYSNGYWFSDNGGTTWSFSAQPFTIYGMHKMPNGTLLLRTSSGTAYSTNSGNSWTPVATSLTDIVSTSSNVLFGVTSVLSTSVNNGATWTTVTGITGLPTSFYINYVETDDTNLYFYIQNYTTSTYEVYKYNIGTKVATKLNNPDRSSESQNYFRKMLVNGGKLYLVYSNTIDFSSDQGTSWGSSSFQSNSVFAIPGAICVGNWGVVYTTQDDGKTWSSTSMPVGSENSYVTDIAVDAAGDFYASGYQSPTLKFTNELIVPPASLPPYIDFNWEPMNGPYGAYVERLLTDDANNVYAMVNAKVFKAEDGADNTWTKKTPAPYGYEYYLQDLAINKTSGKLYGLSYNSIVTSTNGGLTWVDNSAQEYSIQQRGRLKRCPNGDLVFTTYDGKAYVSTNDGVTFGAAKKTFASTDIYALEVTPTNGIYVWLRNANVWELHRSTDRGVNWTLVTLPTLPEGSDFNSFSTDVSGNLYLKTNTDIFKSANTGTTWASIKFNMTGGFDNSRVYQAAANGAIYTTFYYGPYNTQFGIYKLDNGGGTWTKKTSGDFYIYGVSWTGSRLIIATDKGIVVTDDDGTTLTAKNTGLTGLSFNEIELVSENKLLLFGNGSYQSTDLQNWESFDQFSSGRFYSKTDGSLLANFGSRLYTTSDGDNWSEISTMPGSARDLSNNGTSYTAIINNRLYISTDLTTWTELVPTGLPAQNNRDLLSVASDLSGNTVVCLYNYAASKNEVYRIRFGSATKQNVAQEPLFIRFFKGKLMLYDRRGSIYTSTNGTTWIQKGAPSGSKFIITAKNLFFITNYNGGLWLSRDEGTTWQNVGLPGNNGNVEFNDVTVNEYTGYVYAAVYGREVLKSGNVILPDDGQAPVVASFSPLDNSTGVSIRPELKITFDEPVIPQAAKNLYIVDVTNPTIPVETILVTAGVQSGKTFSYIPNNLLGYNKNYFIAIDEKEANPSPPPAEIGAFHDIFNRPFDGFYTQTVWNFSTKSAPTLSSLYPADGATNIPIDTTLSIDFSEAMNIAAGKTLKLYKASAPTVAIETLGACIPQNQFATVSSYPTFSNQPLTLTFDATKGGGQLVGAAKVYAHLFVATHVQGETQNTYYTIGNWGQDDGEGQMTAVAGQANKWSLAMSPSLRSYFNIPANRIIDSVGVVFRNANGSQKATPPSTITGANVAQNGDVFFEVSTSDVLTFSLCTPMDFNTAYIVQAEDNTFASTEGQSLNFVSAATDWNFTTELAPDVTPPVFAAFTAPATFTKGATTNKLELGVTDAGLGVSKVYLHYRGILSEGAYVKVELTFNSTTSKYEVTVPDAWLDAMGLEYYFSADDLKPVPNSATLKATGNADFRTSIAFAAAAPLTIPNLQFGGAVGNYRIFAIPHTLSSNSIASIFEELGTPDPSKYRLLTYDKTKSNSWAEYSKDFTTIARGKGYWFNSLSQVSITVEGARTPDHSKTSAYQMTLAAGWNQIGNPYPFEINWTTIRNTNPTVIGQLNKFVGGSYSVSSQTLSSFEGGFVFVTGTAPVTVAIPFASATGSRITETQESFDRGWLLPLTLTQGESVNDYTAIGMHPEASEQLDQYDLVNPPRFIRYLEANFTKDIDETATLSRDIVPAQSQYTWEFNIEANDQGTATISWSASELNSFSDELYLLDVGTNRLVNMRSTSTYTFKPGPSKRFKIAYGEGAIRELMPSSVQLGQVFPNPTAGAITVAFGLPEAGGNAQQVRIEIVDALGKSLGVINEGVYAAGFHELEWDGTKVLQNAGLFTYRLKVSNTLGEEILQGKIMVKK